MILSGCHLWDLGTMCANVDNIDFCIKVELAAAALIFLAVNTQGWFQVHTNPQIGDAWIASHMGVRFLT